jgi:hypothetical protein
VNAGTDQETRRSAIRVAGDAAKQNIVKSIGIHKIAVKVTISMTARSPQVIVSYACDACLTALHPITRVPRDLLSIIEEKDSTLLNSDCDPPHRRQFSWQATCSL